MPTAGSSRSGAGFPGGARLEGDTRPRGDTRIEGDIRPGGDTRLAGASRAADGVRPLDGVRPSGGIRPLDAARPIFWPLTRNESIALLFLLALAATWAIVEGAPRTPADASATTTVIRIDL